MPLLYQRIAGQSVSRVEALSDGIFAVAMTVLVLNLHIPSRVAGVRDATMGHPLWAGPWPGAEWKLLREIAALGQPVLAYFLSFLTLGLFWLGQQTLLHHTQASNRHLTWLHMAFLFAVTLVPGSTALLANFMGFWIALVVYWLNLVLLGGLLFALGRYAERAGLMKDSCPEGMRKAAERRIVVNQAMYAVAVLAGIFNAYIGVVFIFVLHLNSAFAPSIAPLNKF